MDWDMELVMASPNLWMSATACEFLVGCHDLIKEGTTFVQFKENLNDSASKSKIWLEGENWKDVIDKNEGLNFKNVHYKLLTTFINRDGTPRNKQIYTDTSSLTGLLSVIRNKYSHRGLFCENQLKTLSWGTTSPEGKLSFCENKFLHYWTSRFPTLLPFLWEHFKMNQLEGHMRNFYPASLKHQFMSCKLFDINKTFGEQVASALARDLEQGSVEARFTANNEARTKLEFRSLDLCYLKVISNCTCMEIEMFETEQQNEKKQHVVSRWYEKQDKLNLYDERINALKYESEPPLMEIFKGIILIGSKISDLHEYITQSRLVGAVQKCKKIVIFTSAYHEQKKDIEYFMERFSNTSKLVFSVDPVNWRMLSSHVQNKLRKEGEIIVQGKNFKFGELLMKMSESGCEKVYKNLNRKVLNEFLKHNNRLNIPLPNKHDKSYAGEQLYIKRHIFHRGTVGSHFFTSNFGNDVFVIVKYKAGETPLLQGIISQEVKYNDTFPILKVKTRESKIFVTKEVVDNFRESFKTFKGIDIGGSVHFFGFLGNDKFEWLDTHGNFSNIENTLCKEAETLGVTDEETFLKNIYILPEKAGKIICITDSPGMGKTQILINFAQKLRPKEKTIVLFFELSEFVEKLEEYLSSHDRKNAESDDILLTTVNLSCSPILEKVLLTNFLKFSNSLGFTVEVMLDGMDEVKAEARELAFRLLNIFRNELSWARIWVTGRDHMLDEIRRKLGILGYKFLPYSQIEQIRYLQKFWSNNWRRQANAKNIDPNEDILREFAKKCLEKCLSIPNAAISGIPLQCKMIGEIFEEKVLKFDYSLENFQAICLPDLYGQLLQKNWNIYFREKQQIPLNAADSVVQMVRNEIDRFLAYLSIKLLFSEEKANQLRTHLQIPKRKTEVDKLYTMVLEQGIVENINPLRFVHRSYAEYIIASHICQFLSDHVEEDESFDSLDNQFKEFVWNDVMAAHPFPRIFVHRSVWCFLNIMLTRVFSNLTDTFFQMGNLSTFLNVVKMTQNIPLQLWDYFCNPKYITQFVLTIGSKHENILKLAILKPKYPLALLIFSLHTTNYEIARYIIESLSFGPEHWCTMQELNENKYGILHWTLNFSLGWPQQKWCKNLQNCLSFLRYVVKKDCNRSKEILEERDAKGRTAFLSAVHFALGLNSGTYHKCAGVYNEWYFDEEEEVALDDEQINLLFSTESQNTNVSNPDGNDNGTDLSIYEDESNWRFPNCKIYWSAIDELVRLGADVNAVDYEGNTARHLKYFINEDRYSCGEYDFGYVSFSHSELCVRFIEFFMRRMQQYGVAEPNKLNNAGKTPLQTFLPTIIHYFENSDDQFEEVFGDDNGDAYVDKVLNVFGMYGAL